MEIHMVNSITITKAKALTPQSKSSIHNLQVQLDFSNSQLSVSFTENEKTNTVSIRVPIPKFLAPLVSSFDLLNLSDDRKNNEGWNLFKPPGILWKCHLLTGERWPITGLELAVVHSENLKYDHEEEFVVDDFGDEVTLALASNFSEKEIRGLVVVIQPFMLEIIVIKCANMMCLHLFLEAWKTTRAMKLMENQRSFLNRFLGDAFIAKFYNLSKDIEWKQLCCQCPSIVGVYPSANGYVCVDDGVGLFKCYISSCLLVGGSGDLFRKYTLERISTSQLVKNAIDESSFKTVARDLRNKSPMLQVVSFESKFMVL
ncbi:unnamed protein product [Dovyalis caffra]|uniref:Uncharacterized protein n=1 Tax=Dovyalis caffra TaxID=77055 RepID=A0AAV1RMZ7_9ROSI|nr:unnamed protein product [Dovyalis caffra]